MDDPLVSIVTPAYNAERYISELLASVRDQHYDHVEHIVVDGESTDRTREVLREYESEYNLTWISEPDDSMYHAIEKGFKRASGDIYAWLNADDKYMPWATNIAVDHLSKNDVNWIVGHPARWDESGDLYDVAPIRPYYNRQWLQWGWYEGRGLGWIQQESTFWTADLWESHGGFPDDVQLAGDYYLWRQFAERTAPVQVGTVISGYRTHGGQLSENMEFYYDELPRIGLIPRLMGSLHLGNLYNIYRMIVS